MSDLAQGSGGQSPLNDLDGVLGNGEAPADRDRQLILIGHLKGHVPGPVQAGELLGSIGDEVAVVGEHQGEEGHGCGSADYLPMLAGQEGNVNPPLPAVLASRAVPPSERQAL